MSLLELRDVTKLYQTNGARVAALRNITLEVARNEFVALIGRSGCGKSTLLNLCGAMDFPTSGEVVLDGQVTSRLTDGELTRLRREKVGFVFQSFQLLHTLTAVENVELPLLLAKKRNTRAQALERLRWVEMDAYSGRLPHQLSGGEQQRVAIARALVHQPQLLLADEPTGNLDTATSDIILGLLRRVAQDFGAAVIMATHTRESASLTDRTIALRDGLIVRETSLAKEYSAG